MRLFAPAAFRYPPQTGHDYAYGFHDVHDDTLARTLIIAGLMQDDSKGPDPASPTATNALAAPLSLIADDAGTAWYACPALLSVTAMLVSGSATVVLLEALSKDGTTVSTVATISCDTASQALSAAVLMKDTAQFRVRRSSGTGSIAIYLEK